MNSQNFLKLMTILFFLFLGEGEDKKKLSQLIENKGLKENFLLGFKNNIYSFMRNSDIL